MNLKAAGWSSAHEKNVISDVTISITRLHAKTAHAVWCEPCISELCVFVSLEKDQLSWFRRHCTAELHSATNYSHPDIIAYSIYSDPQFNHMPAQNALHHQPLVSHEQQDEPDLFNCLFRVLYRVHSPGRVAGHVSDVPELG